MEEIANLFHGFAVVIQPQNLLLMVIGILLGVIIGVLPGLGGANGVAILLPLTFSMSPTSAIIMLSCIYWGALFGRAMVGGHHVRRSPDGPKGSGRRGTDSGIHLVLRWCAVRRDGHHPGRPAG